MSSGHLEIGESYLEAAKRELKEELGLANMELQDIGSTQAQDTGISFKGTAFNIRHMFQVYVCKANPVKLNKDEVKNVFWANQKEVCKDMQINPKKYTNGFKSTLRLFLSK